MGRIVYRLVTRDDTVHRNDEPFRDSDVHMRNRLLDVHREEHASGVHTAQQ